MNLPCQKANACFKLIPEHNLRYPFQFITKKRLYTDLAFINVIIGMHGFLATKLTS